MILQICAVRDRAADVFGMPIFAPTIGVAVRGFVDQVNRADANNQFYKHPEDFDLYHLGTFDDATGEVVKAERPRQVCIGKDVVRK